MYYTDKLKISDPEILKFYEEIIYNIKNSIIQRNIDINKFCYANKIDVDEFIAIIKEPIQCYSVYVDLLKKIKDFR